MSNVKLSRTQEELLRAMQDGVQVYYMPFMGRSSNAYYFRSDTLARVTNSAARLKKLGLATFVVSNPLRRDELRLTEAGKLWGKHE